MIRLHRYRLPFHTLFRSTGQSWSHREGLLLEWETDGSGWIAEAAPLPGRSRETLADVIEQATESRDLMPQWIVRESPLPSRLHPSLRFALSALRLQHRDSTPKPGPGRGEPDQKSTDPSVEQIESSPLRMNGVIGLGSSDTLSETLNERLREGYRTIKIKLDRNPEPILLLLREASDSHPGLRFRLDANRSWSREEALHWLGQMESLPIEYCEEPLRRPTLETLVRLQETTSIPIALDESLTHPTDLHHLTNHPLLSTIILKATLLGDLEEIRNATLSLNRPLRTIWSSSLESAVGRTTLRRAAWRWGEATEAHGLDTGSLFREDLLREDPLTPDRGPTRDPAICHTWAAPASMLRRERLTELR